MSEIEGHPSLELDNGNVITVCVECGQMRTILWLLGDRWYCTQCKAKGENRPKVIPIS
jgi:translation initiation factor 2 beta subunit (eIF-2beta)/eIF-5